MSDGAVSFCAWCGQPDPDPAEHEKCQARLALVDPPRFCVRCARRMVVQVTPAGWVATCSRHGQLTAN
ncbi:MAG TPA: hypothetical protein VGL80_10085 [Pseudonocardiaceae bacterium]